MLAMVLIFAVILALVYCIILMFKKASLEDLIEFFKATNNLAIALAVTILVAIAIVLLF